MTSKKINTVSNIFGVRLYLVAALILSAFFSGYCQDITFHKVFPPNSSSWQHVTGITQDKNGTMWFATKIGLFSYNGYEMKAYKNDPLNPNSIASNLLGTVCADMDGNIWIGTLGNGLDKFDPVAGIFTHYRQNITDQSRWDYINALLVDQDNGLWIGTGSGFERYDAINDEFIHFSNIPNDSTSLSYNEVITIYQDRDEEIWVGTGSVYSDTRDDFELGGLNRMDNETGTFTRYKNDPENPNSLINNKVSAIFEDSKGVLWIGTAGDGLHTMDKSSGKITRHRYDPESPEKLSRPPINPLFSDNDHITFFIEDVTGAIWIGTSDAGLSYYDPVTNRVSHFQSEKTEGKYNERTSWAAYTSSDGVLWISSLFGTLYRIDPQQSTIPHIDLPGRSVNSFFEDKNGALWWGSDKIYVSSNKYENLIQQINSELHQASTNFDYVKVIKEDSNGQILIGGGGGLIILNLTTKQFTHYESDPDDNNTLSNNNIFSISEDSRKNFWIATLMGINRLNPASGEIKRYYVDDGNKDLFGPNFIDNVLVDQKDRIWVALSNGGGLCMLNTESGKFDKYLNAFMVHCIFKDSEDMVWAGTNEGLFYFDSASGTYVKFSDPNSLNDIISVSNIIEDDNKNIWISAGSGIIKINASRTETKSFGTNYGVYSETLNKDASYKDRNGYLYFGEDNGYYKFLPSEITADSRPPQVVITSFNVGNQAENTVTGERAEIFSLQEKISLSYNQNTFSFDFAVIDYSNPPSNQHLFMLENYNDTWRKANADRRAYFFNVPPGKYTFRVKGANSYGVWAEKAIDVIISPPWWKTIWAYIVYGIFFITGVWLIYNFQRQRVIRAERARTQQKELEQAREIEKAYKKLEVAHESLKSTQSQLIQSEKMASLGELTAGIAHEIQNPLNFVNNFSEVSSELIDEMNEELEKNEIAEVKSIAGDIKLNLEKINYHGQRASGIVKSMLEHSRSGDGKKELTDINVLADEYLRLSYHGLRAKDKSFNAAFKTDFDDTLPKINIVPQEIGRVLLNLINNAFYAVQVETQNSASLQQTSQKQPDYIPTVFLSTKNMGDHIEIQVKDNGPGIPPEIKDKIFQPFFTTKPTGKGTGLGLSMSYDIITNGHGGELIVESPPAGRVGEEGKGSLFTIVLPCKNEKT